MNPRLDRLYWHEDHGLIVGADLVAHTDRFTVAPDFDTDPVRWTLLDHGLPVFRGVMDDCEAAACREVTEEAYAPHYQHYAWIGGPGPKPC